MCKEGGRLGGHFLYSFDYIHPPNKDKKKRIDLVFYHLPPPIYFV